MTTIPIPNPPAAMAFAKAMRDIADVMIGAVETNDIQLYLECQALFDELCHPQADAKSHTAQKAVLLDQYVPIMKQMIAGAPNPFSERLEEIERDLSRGLLKACIDAAPAEMQPALEELMAKKGMA